MSAVPTSPEHIRASLTAEIGAAEGLAPLTREALLVAFVPFAELFCREQALATPEAGRRIAEATAAVAAAVIGHLHMNARRSGVDMDTSIRRFTAEVEKRTLDMLAGDGLRPQNGGRWE